MTTQQPEETDVSEAGNAYVVPGLRGDDAAQPQEVPGETLIPTDDSDEDMCIVFATLNATELRRIQVRRDSSNWPAYRVHHHLSLDEYLERSGAADVLFKDEFGVEYGTFMYILEHISSHSAFSHFVGRSRMLPVDKQLLLTLSKMRHNITYRQMERYWGIPKASIKLFYLRTICAISSLEEKFVRFPKTLTEYEKMSMDFAEYHFLDGCVGIIDGTMFKIRKPSRQYEPEAKRYYHHKDKWCVGAQLIIDAHGTITQALYGYPGAIHDTNAYHAMSAFAHRNEMVANGFYLLADSGYPCRGYLMCPFDIDELKGPNVDSRIKYNDFISSRRCLVERVIGELKERFRILSQRSDVRDLQLFRGVICASIVIHNICKRLQDSLVLAPSAPIHDEMAVGTDSPNRLGTLPSVLPFETTQEAREQYSIGNKVRNLLTELCATSQMRDVRRRLVSSYEINRI
eukprot:ANDGO_07439.mRNA.1 hypothetical protein